MKDIIMTEVLCATPNLCTSVLKKLRSKTGFIFFNTEIQRTLGYTEEINSTTR